MLSFRNLGIFLFGIFATSVSFAGENSAPKEELQELVERLEKIRLSHHVPSFSLSLVSKDEVLINAYRGSARRKPGKRVRSKSIYRIGSISKTFAGMALLKLEEAKKLKLNDKLKLYAPELPLSNPWSVEHPVRLVHLLEHTAGLLDLSKKEFDYPASDKMSLKQAFAVSPQQRVCHWPPGRYVSYTNAGVGYAAYVLEKVTGKKYEEYVAEELFEPLKMNSANFYRSGKVKQWLVTGYDTDGETTIPYWNMLFRPFGAINVEAAEMGNFVQMLLNNGEYNGTRILTEASIKKLETPHSTLAAASGLTYGHGVGNYQYIYNNTLFHGHGGDADGYLSYYAYNRDSGLGYFIVINAFNHVAIDAMKAALQDYITDGLDASVTPGIALKAKQYEKLLGRYQAQTYRMPWYKPSVLVEDRIDVKAENGKLYLLYKNGEKEKLIAVTTRHFRFAEQPVATVAFIEKNNQVYLQGDMGNYKRLAW